MSIDQSIRFAVVYPMIDLRGADTDRVRTWTHGQTLTRECYCVLVASDGTSPSQELTAPALLGPHDKLLRVPGARDTEMWNAGAALGGTPWLRFIEGHRLAA